eukprot:184077-Lingulodinium_polyedra.AAC.1
MLRSNRPLAAATARESHALHTPCEHRNWCSHGVREACDLRRRVWLLIGCCSGAASALLGRCLGCGVGAAR